jgi:hypothetical protein
MYASILVDGGSDSVPSAEDPLPELAVCVGSTYSSVARVAVVAI